MFFKIVFRDTSVRVWDRASNQCTAVLNAHDGVVYCVCHIGEGKFVSGSEVCTPSTNMPFILDMLSHAPVLAFFRTH